VNVASFDAPGLDAVDLHCLLGLELLPEAGGAATFVAVESERVLTVDFAVDQVARLLKVVRNGEVAKRSLDTVVVDASDEMRVIGGVASG